MGLKSNPTYAFINNTNVHPSELQVQYPSSGTWDIDINAIDPS